MNLLPPSRALRRARTLAALVALLAVTGCATLQELIAVEHLDFRIERLSRVEVGGVELTGLVPPGNVGLVDLAFLTGELAVSREMPLVVTLDVRADNPETNTDARLVQMDWTLVLDERETVSGRVTDEIVVPSGAGTTFPVEAELDLLEFFDGGASDLVDLVRSAAGMNDTPPTVALQILPTVRTAFGEIPYDRPFRITLVE